MVYRKGSQQRYFPQPATREIRIHDQNSNPKPEWSNEISSIEIIIAPPLWLSWWAKLLYVISGIGTLFIGLWAYKRKLN